MTSIQKQKSQRLHNGAAVITALLVVVIATLAVSSLIWRVFAMGKSVEVLAARVQAHEVAVASIDWARVILREDARISATDHLAEPWAVPLADTRLGENLQPKNGRVDDNEASVAGRIEDAQSRFNLRNLLLTGERGDTAQAGFLRMCGLVGVSAAQAGLIVERVKDIYQTSRNNRTESASSPTLTGDAPTAIDNVIQGTTQPLLRWQDVRNTPNLSGETWQRLKPYVVWLPQPSQVNANTASAEVLYSAMPSVDWASVQQLVSYRDRLSFKDTNDIASRFSNSKNIHIDPALVSVNSQFFIVSGAVEVKQARVVNQALLQREAGKVFVVWRAET